MNTTSSRRARTFVTVALLTLCLQAAPWSDARAAAQDRRPRTSDVRALVQRMADVHEIQELLAEYMRLLETRDWVRYAQLFAKNGELHFNQYDLIGSQVIRETMLKTAPNDPARPPAPAADLLTNVSIEVTGDTGTSTSRWTGITLGADNKPAVTRAGHYGDTLTRENGRWRFQKRVVYVDVTPAVPAPAPTR